MRLDEAALYLSSKFISLIDRQTKIDAYMAVLKARWHFDDEQLQTIAEPRAILYVNNGALLVHPGLNLKEKHGYGVIASMPYSELFKDCYNLSYEHCNNPVVVSLKKTEEYEKPKYYYDFNTMVEDVLEKESKDYFITKEDYLLVPIGETQTEQMWDFLVLDNPYDSYYHIVGKVTIPKSFRS